MPLMNCDCFIKINVAVPQNSRSRVVLFQYPRKRKGAINLLNNYFIKPVDVIVKLLFSKFLNTPLKVMFMLSNKLHFSNHPEKG
jgi:hypothetical protein